jgi:hypothetical protein
MISAIRGEARRAIMRRDFVRAAEEAEAELERTGLAYEMNDVHAYLANRLAGRRARRPKLKPWR